MIARELLCLVDQGQHDIAVSQVDELVRSDRAASTVVPVGLALFALAANEVHRRARVLGAGPKPGPGELELLDVSGEPIQIDEVDPLPRAALRALLAAVAGHELDAADQLRIALVHEPRHASALLMICLMWTLEITGPTGRNS